MLCSLEIAQFRDFTVYLPFSLCRAESLQLSFQALDNKHKYLTRDRGSHSVLGLPAFCIGTTHLWQKIVRASHEHFCLNVHFLTIKKQWRDSVFVVFVCLLLHKILETRSLEADLGKKAGKLSGLISHLFLFPLF